MCRTFGIDDELIEVWRHGVVLEGHELADTFNVPDYPSVLSQPDVAAAELDRLTQEGKIHWFEPQRVPSDLNIAPTTLILKGDRSRLVHDWTKAGLNQHLTTPSSLSDNMDDLIKLLWKHCHIAGLDIKDCFLHWAVHSSCRRRLGVRHPLSGRVGVYLFLPLGLRCAPGINERFVAAVVKAAARPLRIHVCRYVDDLRIVNTERLPPIQDANLLNLQLHCLKENLEACGLKIHVKPGKLIKATTNIDWIGWAVATDELKVYLTPAKQAKGFELCKNLLLSHLRGETTTTRTVLSAAGFLNFVCGIIRQGRPYIRALYQDVATTQVFQAWRQGRRQDPQLRLSDQARDDLAWWCSTLCTRLYRALHVVHGRVFIWHQRHPDLEQLKQLTLEADLVAVIYTDASGEIGWGAACGSRWTQGRWRLDEMHLSINFKELEAYRRALLHFQDMVREKLVLVKTDNTATVHYINCGTGRNKVLADLARAIRSQEVSLSCESVAIHLPGVKNVTADALSRMKVMAAHRDPMPDRCLRRKLFDELQARHGPCIIDGMTADDGHNTLLERKWNPSQSVFEQDLDGPLVWLFPPSDMIGLLLNFISDKQKLGVKVSVRLLLPEDTKAPWFRFCKAFKRLARFRKGSDLFRNFDGEVWRKSPPTPVPYVVLQS